MQEHAQSMTRNANPRVARKATPPQKQIVITGTGRAGTTFLMALLTHLHLPTGFTPAEFNNCSNVYECNHAGYEWGELTAPMLPPLFAKGVVIVKSPWLAAEREARAWLAADSGVEHVIVPVRDLGNVSKSRAARGHGNGGLPPGVRDGAALEHINEHVLSQLLVLIALNDKPSTLLAFPRHVVDAGYAWDKLSWLCARYRVTEAEFREAHSAVSKPSLVHRRARRRARV